MNKAHTHGLFLALEATEPEGLAQAWSRRALALHGASPDLAWRQARSWGAPGDVEHDTQAPRPAITVIDVGGLWPASLDEPMPQSPGVLVLTAGPGSEQAQAWLGAGADMVVPDGTSWRELEARVRALLRPAARCPQAEAGHLSLDLNLNLSVSPPGLRWHDGRQLALAPREAQLLQVLARRQGRPGTKMELLVDLGWRQEGRTPPFLELVVSRLRARLRAELGEDAAQSLETRRGAGYAWRPERLPEQV